LGHRLAKENASFLAIVETARHFAAASS